ncbi:hypothetical protein BD410DRAFT_893279 [Rickenella mellea]|uniref:F-box domain-containing protein n=1 Tax=Rickenella mellea TaxID=50990 RepID=A0A4R5XG13_9AGAM|nr:hypothetical protein BD410DRAFT_893279 [Rickenella mellea]
MWHWSFADEILAMIFEAGYTSDLKGNRFAITLSHVNVRFRHISLKNPRLWSTVTNYQGASELEEFLARSKQSGISVKVSGEQIPATTSADIFFPLVIPHRHRWIEFVHEFDDDLGVADSPSQLAETTFELPMLKRLIDHSAYLSSTLAKWHMPSLAEYSGEWFPGCSSTSLVSCALNLLWDSEPEFAGLDGLLSLLSNNPGIRSITLLFHECIKYMVRGRVDSKASLPCLETFSVEFVGGCHNVDDDLKLFLESLHLPRLSEFSLQLSPHPDSDRTHPSDTDTIFRILLRNLYSTVQTLNLVADAVYEICCTDLENLIAGLPSLRRLYVEAPGLRPTSGIWQGDPPPPLHYVELSKCD